MPPKPFHFPCPNPRFFMPSSTSLTPVSGFLRRTKSSVSRLVTPSPILPAPLVLPLPVAVVAEEATVAVVVVMARRAKAPRVVVVVLLLLLMLLLLPRLPRAGCSWGPTSLLLAATKEGAVAAAPRTEGRANAARRTLALVGVAEAAAANNDVGVVVVADRRRRAAGSLRSSRQQQLQLLAAPRDIQPNGCCCVCGWRGGMHGIEGR